MFEDAFRDFKLDARRTAFVGDRWRDVVGAKKFGGRGIMIESPVTTAEDRRLAERDGIERAASLQEAVGMLLGLTDRNSIT
jgi:FMN phosphatase YigB (HAD superfamily)